MQVYRCSIMFGIWIIWKDTIHKKKDISIDTDRASVRLRLFVAVVGSIAFAILKAGHELVVLT